MEVPKKIYLYTEGYILDNDWLYEAPKEFTSFEYTRTDAFIEKAIEFIQKHTSEIYLDYQTDKEDWIKDFKNYMKGE